MNYTDKYLIHDISNKAFRLKYGTKEKSKKKGQKVKKCYTTEARQRSKKERQEWWKRLTFEQQQTYIEEKQTQKAKERENQPERVLEYNPEYPWMTEGVNESNRDDWLAMIKKKNPWLKVA